MKLPITPFLDSEAQRSTAEPNDYFRVGDNPGVNEISDLQRPFLQGFVLN